MKIRPYQPADEAAVIALWQECGLQRWSDPKKDIARKRQVNPEWFLVGEIDGVVMALMRAVGCAKINLQVRTSNAGVIAFYERLGFKLDEVVSMGKRLLPD